MPRRIRSAATGTAEPASATLDIVVYRPSSEDSSAPPAALPDHLTIKDLPTGDRPRERLKALGATTLSDAELLAILLRVGTAEETAVTLAQRLLAAYGGWSGLARAPFGELEALHGLGAAKVAQLKAALEIGRRLLRLTPEDRVSVENPEALGRLLVGEMGPLEQEVLRCVLLNTKHQVITMVDVHRGSLNSSLVRPGDVFREPVRQGAGAVIIAHNHPSGDPTPSRQDIEVTEQLVAAGKLLDIDVLDHLIIGRTWLSLRQRGLGFKG